MSNSLTNDVAIIMGSDSDWPVMEDAAKALDSFGISYTADVVSAHRMPEEMVEFAKTAASKGYKVIIAGAGGAAHLPGMVASLTTLPVIGVPVSLKNLEGMDSLLSIVQMPGGIPVATVGIDNAKNAGILAARIIGSSDSAVAKKIEAQLASLSTEAKAKGAQLSARRSTKTGFN
ncbi:MAG: 5-(carboxyamino)imidazole ribonucleotide mutase [Candidatus Planktophila sp.]|jgi:5-(carboxyamino)imidazole ribonucleotide mutase|nr:5-(carboxyamino)imidazole ribonucleotide mutase [Candidatus Planktophila sp.]MBP7903534.1 5-(carboxyamino)imidazole ribonucleotide mutase [Candidatus Planktophila sp.]